MIDHLPPLRDIVREFDLAPKKSLGQNFLFDANLTDKIARSAGDLSAEAPALVHALADQAMLWISWPRRAAGHISDITENALREIFLPLGVVDVKVAALGEDWSALKFVRRKENRRS